MCIRDRDNTLRVRGKGNKERLLYLNEACQDAIRQYLKVRPVDGVQDKHALFLKMCIRDSGTVIRYEMAVSLFFPAIPMVRRSAFRTGDDIVRLFELFTLSLIHI